ncbi:MAG: nucleotide exchange factor GrpE [Clostridia bacterium]|nr:nucleotide exchange factor GrpE [Clostridia bacterium]
MEEENEENKKIDQENKNIQEEVESVQNKTETSQEESKVIQQQSQIDELTDRYKRLLAEFENFKKRSQKERDGLYGLITGDVVSTILPIMDNLEKATEAKTEDKNYQEGVKMVFKQLSEALSRFGLKEIDAKPGTKFDPELHEAVSHIDDLNKGEKEITEEFRKGYMIGSKVIRHSMVIVAN